MTGARRKAALAVGAVIGFGTLAVAGIGFVGSYAAVRNLAEAKGFGEIATVFPIGIDAGIVVLLALDLLFTWLRMPFPLLRHGAWLLTGATIAFNAATAWPDPVGTGMHATIPVLFVVIIEAARHAVGRIADLTANRHMESVRLARWLLAPIATFSVWRRMKLWEIGDYRQALGLEADRLICRARLRADYGRGWRRKAPMDKLLPLRLTKFGVPLAPASAPADSIPAPVVELERAETFEDYAADALSIATSDPVPALPTGAEQSTGTGAVPAPQQAPVPAPHNPHGHPDDDAVPAPPQMPANTPLPVPAETAAAAGQQAEPEAEAAPGPAVPPNLPAGYEHAAHATGKDTGTAPEPAPVPAPAPAPGHQSDGARTDAVPAPQQTPVSAAAPAPAPAAPPAAGKEPQPEAEPAPPEAPEHARKPARTAAATKRRTTAKAAVAKAGRTRRPTLTDDELLERVRDLGPGESLLSARYTARQVGCDDKRAKAALEALGRLRPPTP
ncbi:DUF2637 domain-containing protein [Streptomyces sp. MAA16]|uniref:DUF2637 domain-containing protein n=1 Tax=Streptomyces sp. MAA16 TaxID=3035116 RepID=UPI0024750126|nr:DUF2637 domain-containing protein [Streptomyces sp. MAA16]